MSCPKENRLVIQRLILLGKVLGGSWDYMWEGVGRIMGAWEGWWVHRGGRPSPIWWSHFYPISRVTLCIITDEVGNNRVVITDELVMLAECDSSQFLGLFLMVSFVVS